MSHQSGITVSKALQETFSTAFNTTDTRLIRINIEQETLVETATRPASKAWDAEFNELVLPLLDENQAAFLMYRKDEQNAHGFVWIMICWVPDWAPVREKMLYASTRATLRKEFGDYRVGDEVFGTSQEDVSLDGYLKHRESNDAPPPLTAAEEEAKEIKQRECGVDIGASTRRTTHGGVSFPLTEAASEGLKKFHEKVSNYIQLSVDTEKEVIDLEAVDEFTVEELSSHIPTDHPRYHFYRFDHEFEGQRIDPVIFIYSCPGYNCKIKERMLYSSCRNPLLDEVEQGFSINVEKRLEIAEASEIANDLLFDELHPQALEKKKSFIRPKAPGKGKRKLLRGGDTGMEE